MGIESATGKYEAWLGRHVATVPADVATKHAKMADARSPFPFLRATFYRWAKRFPKVCGGLKTHEVGRDPSAAPAVVGVGDLHAENFGTWRDADGRLVWGVNDFDEACELPYTNDLVRLAASVIVAAADGQLTIGGGRACEAILSGYAS